MITDPREGLARSGFPGCSAGIILPWWQHKFHNNGPSLRADASRPSLIPPQT
jgi:hypothetical protein